MIGDYFSSFPGLHINSFPALLPVIFILLVVLVPISMAATQKTQTAVLSAGSLGFPFTTPDPFLFCVFHNDAYPPGDENMAAPKRGNGADFDPNQPYRMYHGDRVPGFPSHPHRGFETITATIHGIIDHTDSYGNAGRYGHGDLQWMTAGSGVLHAEMFPLVNNNAGNPLKFFQIWLNLCSENKMAKPEFVMHWAEDVPKWESEGGLCSVTIWAGSYLNISALSPTKKSWAANPENEVCVWLFQVRPGGSAKLPRAKSNLTNRALYLVEGQRIKFSSGEVFRNSAHINLNASIEVDINNIGADIATFLVLQGKPINEPVAQSGPFVMNTREEIRQAISDYRSTQFGGWPWPQSGPIFNRERGRFALLDGEESRPPTLTADTDVVNSEIANDGEEIHK